MGHLQADQKGACCFFFLFQSPVRTDGRYPSPGANHPRTAPNTGTTTTYRTPGQPRRKGAPLSPPPPNGVSVGNSSYRWLYPIECKQGLLECFSVYAIEFSFQRRLRAKSKRGQEGDSGCSRRPRAAQRGLLGGSKLAETHLAGTASLNSKTSTVTCPGHAGGTPQLSQWFSSQRWDGIGQLAVEVFHHQLSAANSAWQTLCRTIQRGIAEEQDK